MFEATTTAFHIKGITQPFTSNLQFYSLAVSTTFLYIFLLVIFLTTKLSWKLRHTSVV